MYLKFETPNVVGESTDEEHKGQIEILSYMHGESQPTQSARSAAGSAAGKVSIMDFAVTKYLDKSSPILNLACCTGQHYKKVTIQLFRATKDAGKPVKYMEYVLEEVIISSYKVVSSGGDVPIESLTFNFGKIRWSYIPQKKEAPGGAEPAIATGWSLMTNSNSPA